MGKRALFWAAPEANPQGEARGQAPPLGKHALFSGVPRTDEEPENDPTLNPIARRGPVTVECERCRAVSRVGVLDLLIYQFPIGYWLPRGKFDHRMSCPVCRRRTWASVTLRKR